jgi:rubredoxin
MKAYVCTVCGYLYDEESAKKNVEGKLISFEDLSDDWVCPVCAVNQDLFVSTDSDRTKDVPTE